MDNMRAPPLLCAALKCVFPFLYIGISVEIIQSTEKKNACAQIKQSETSSVHQGYAETPKKVSAIIKQPYFTVQGHTEPDPLPACTGQEAGNHPGQDKSQTSVQSSTCWTEMPEDVSPRSHTSCAVR